MNRPVNTGTADHIQNIAPAAGLPSLVKGVLPRGAGRRYQPDPPGQVSEVRGGEAASRL